MAKLRCGRCRSPLRESWDLKQTVCTLSCPDCGEETKITYGNYRERTGLCETCGAAMETHPRCKGCGALCGSGHIYSLITYREKKLCRSCKAQWKAMEKDRGKKLSWGGG